MDGKPFWQSKTLVFNVLALVVAVASAFGYADFVPAPWVGQIAPVILILINLLLRLVTTEPVRR